MFYAMLKYVSYKSDDQLIFWKKTFLVRLAKNTECRQQLLGILSSVPNGLFKTVYIFVLFFIEKKVRTFSISAFSKNWLQYFLRL